MFNLVCVGDDEMELPLLPLSTLIITNSSFCRTKTKTWERRDTTHCSPALRLFIPSSSTLKTSHRLFSLRFTTSQGPRAETADEKPTQICTSRTNNGCHNPNPHGISSYGWLRYLTCSWRSACWSFFVYLLCLALAGEAHGESALSFRYPCEDVSGYYASVEHEEGEALMRTLSSIVSNHRKLSYKEVWDALKILDAADVDNPQASQDIVEIYSLRVVPKLLAGNPEGWNREHLWPRSYGLKGGPSLTDLHNIRPADVNVNSSRGNKYYGECIATSTHCLKPANEEAAFDTETDKERWAPPLQVRGDIARALMYMAVCYGFNQPDANANLHLSDSPSSSKNEMGLLSTLLKWNELDPPSRAEKLRNSRVCKLYQHNRNPFVDHPEYAKLIWKQATPSHQTLGMSSLNAWINEFHYENSGKDHNEFIEIVVGPSENARGFYIVLYNGVNGKVYRSISLVENTIFHKTNGGSGFMLYTAFLPLQNGPGDGIALISDNDKDQPQIIQFISYEGVVKATNGPAKGMESVDIGLEETETSSELDSLGLTGTRVTDLKWKIFINEASPSKLNIGQSLSNK